MLKIKNFSFNPFSERTILMWDESLECVVVDPGCYDEAELGSLVSEIEKENLKPQAIWLTHGHFDHIYGVKAIADKYSLPILMHFDDRAIMKNNLDMAERFGLALPNIDFETIEIEDEQLIGFGNSKFKVITTPGHTPGCVCFYNEEAKVLISGDTLFAGSIGRTDHMGGDYDKLIVSIMDKLMGIDTDVIIIPGHGPTSNIGKERTHNPFLQPFNEPEDTMMDI